MQKMSNSKKRVFIINVRKTDFDPKMCNEMLG